MGSLATGELRGRSARIRVDDQGNRESFVLSGVPADDQTAKRGRMTAMAQIATRLIAAGHQDKVVELLKMAARTRPGKPWEQVILPMVETLCREGGVEPLANGSASAPSTVREIGRQWREGDLHRRYPDHIAEKEESSVKRDGEIARIYVDDAIGDKDPAAVTLDDCELVMAGIPEGKSSSVRRAVGQYMRRLLQMCVYPLRLRQTNPIPKGWLPKFGKAKALECLYPDEDRSLLGQTETPLLRRLTFGFLDREGTRTAEAGSLVWRDIDLERGRVSLDENKTDDPRDWELDPGVWRALKIWHDHFCIDPQPGDRVFAEQGVPINMNRLPDQLRRDLKRAGVKRDKLFESSEVRRQIRAHDLRATFVTIALASGKTDTWVRDRTGHTTTGMLERYRRKARGWNLGALDPLDEAIPEFRPFRQPSERPSSAPSRPISGHPEITIPQETAPILHSGHDVEAMRIAFDTTSQAIDDASNVSESTHDAGDGDVKAKTAPRGVGRSDGAVDAEDILDRLTRSLDRATAAEQWDVAKTILRQIERVEIARAGGKVASLDEARARRGR